MYDWRLKQKEKLLIVFLRISYRVVAFVLDYCASRDVRDKSNLILAFTFKTRKEVAKQCIRYT